LERVRKFVAFSAMAGILTPIVTINWGEFQALPASSFSGLLVMILFGVAAERLSVSMAVGGSGQSNSTNSVAYLPLLATVLLFGPGAAVLFLAIAHVVGDFLIWKKQAIKGVFNVSQHIFSASIGGLAFYLTGGRAAAINGLSMEPVTPTFSWIPLLAFGIVYLGVNHAMVARVVSLATGTPFLTVWHQVVGKGGSNLFYDVLVAPVAVAIALMGMHLGVWGLIMAGLPLLAIRNAHLGQFRLQQANQDLLNALVKAIETRDPYTSGHSLRVANLAKLVAEGLGLSRKLIDEVEQSALLHDIGKIDARYTEILGKPSKLTQEERTMIESHVTRGVELLETMSSVSSSVIKNVLHHHERWDGRGYPMQLAGQDIPLGARIINVCDAVDAMLSDRPYRKALSLETVRNELETYSGIQFDPAVAKVLVGSEVLEKHSIEARGRRGQSTALPEIETPPPAKSYRGRRSSVAT
jgi:putative nucleotidyltransferase with HDIG domain